MIVRVLRVGRARLVQRVPATTRRRWRRTLFRARWGNLRRLRPMSSRFGFDRGTPVDRSYTQEFLARHARDVRGVVGEIADDGYTRMFGGAAVERAEIVDIDSANPRASIVADLAHPQGLPARAFDCLIVTQTLQYVSDPAAAVRTCEQALKPGGVLLLAVPALAAHDTVETDDSDFWRFWPAGLAHLLEGSFERDAIEVESRGNLVAAIAFLHGLAAEELRPAELAANDSRFPIVVHARATADRGGPA